MPLRSYNKNQTVLWVIFTIVYKFYTDSMGPVRLCGDAPAPLLICYFSIAVIKHHDQCNLQKEKFIWAYSPRGGISIHHHLCRKEWEGVCGLTVLEEHKNPSSPSQQESVGGLVWD